MDLRLLGPILGLAMLLSAGVGADFGEDTGFSGRVADCTVCHSPPHPTHDDAEVVVDGLPATWVPGQTYALTLGVAGGPPARPAPFAQGGFSLEAERGRFSAAPGFEDAVYEPRPGRLSYTAEGSLLREWKVLWTAPGLDERPGSIRFWLAVLAADGGHAVDGSGVDDQSERYDSTATATAVVAPDPAGVEAWRALPLTPPAVAGEHHQVRPGSSLILEGRHTDGNATELWWRFDDGPWQVRQTGPEWRLALAEVPSGSTGLWLRSGSDDRSSPAIRVVIEAPGPLARLTPFPFSSTLLPLAIAWRIRP